MLISYSPAQEGLRDDLREYFAALMTPERRAAVAGNGDGDYGDGTVYKGMVKQLGEDGWLALSWPKEYGGRGASTFDHLIFTDEAARAGVPLPFLTINTVGPTIMRYGSREQKEFFLPRIAAGDLHFSIGYSEPDAGTDLASLRTRAVRDGDEYVINGQKMWTSLIDYADYVWLACRTDPDAQRHRGLSILIVPRDARGVSWTDVRTVAYAKTSATYFHDVRVPAGALVGELNHGWPLITNQLNRERVSLTPSAPLEQALGQVVEWASATTLPDGRRVIDQEWVQVHLARVHAKLQYQRLKNWQIASGDAVSAPDASAAKVFGTEFVLEQTRLLMEVLGPRAVVQSDSPEALLKGRLERMYRGYIVMTYGGGTNEIQRDIIAQFGLQLPANRR